jgi:hypothetical protein
MMIVMIVPAEIRTRVIDLKAGERGACKPEVEYTHKTGKNGYLPSHSHTSEIHHTRSIAPAP